MHQVITKRNLGRGAFVFEMGTIYTYVRESETRETRVA